MTRFLIIGRLRSGTTMLQRALRAHPNVSMFHDEVDPRPFFGEGLGLFARSGGKKLPPSERVQLPGLLFDSLSLVQREKPAIQAHGIKCALNKLDAAELVVDQLGRHYPEVKVILIQRKHLLKQYISYQRAEKYGYWHSVDQGQPDKKLPLRIKRSGFLQFAYESKKVDETLLSLSKTQDCLTLNYETDLVQGLSEAFIKVCHFLNIRPIDFSPHVMEKLQPADPDSIQHLAQCQKLFEKIKDLKSEQIQAMHWWHFKQQDLKDGFKNLIKQKLLKR